MSTLQCVVEGDGDVKALPVLLRRILLERLGFAHIQVPRPVKANAPQIFHRGNWHHVQMAAALARSAPSQPAAILVLLDTDGEHCPAIEGPRLLAQARTQAGGLPCEVILAHCEFETWFLAAAESLGGQRGLPVGIEPPPSPEELRGAKEWLAEQMPRAQCYSETKDQPALAAAFNMDLARQRSPSFDKLWRSVETLARQIEP